MFSQRAPESLWERSKGPLGAPEGASDHQKDSQSGLLGPTSALRRAKMGPPGPKWELQETQNGFRRGCSRLFLGHVGLFARSTFEKLVD